MNVSPYFITKIVRHGTSYGMVIPRLLREAMGLHLNQFVVLKRVDKALIVQPFQISGLFSLEGVQVPAEQILDASGRTYVGIK